MATEQVDLALRLFQLIALALPAIGLLMGVMAEMHKRTKEVKDYNTQAPTQTVGAIPELRASHYADFALAQYSIIFFILSGLVLLVFYFLQMIWLLRFGVVLIAVALICLGLSVFMMPRMNLNRSLRSIKSRFKRIFKDNWK